MRSGGESEGRRARSVEVGGTCTCTCKCMGMGTCVERRGTHKPGKDTHRGSLSAARRVAQIVWALSACLCCCACLRQGGEGVTELCGYPSRPMWLRCACLRERPKAVCDRRALRLSLAGDRATVYIRLCSALGGVGAFVAGCSSAFSSGAEVRLRATRARGAHIDRKSVV